MNNPIKYCLPSIVFILVCGVAQADTEAASTDTAAEATTAQASNATTTESTQSGSVARSAITSAIEHREPTDQLSSISNEQNKVFFFTELKDFHGQSVVHRWTYNGEVKAEVNFDVGGPRWRVWSSKQLQPEWTGSWEIAVIDSAGNVVSTETFSYNAASNNIAEASEPAAAVDVEGVSQ